MPAEVFLEAVHGPIPGQEEIQFTQCSRYVFSSFLLGAEEQLLQRVDVCHLLEQRVPPSVVSLWWRGHAAAVTGLLLVLAVSCDPVLASYWSLLHVL